MRFNLSIFGESTFRILWQKKMAVSLFVGTAVAIERGLVYFGSEVRRISYIAGLSDPQMA